MRKRLLTILLAVLVCLGALPLEAGAGYTGYSDVPEGHWAGESIRRATELGLFQGVEEGRFGLGQPISRAAFSAALVRLFGWTEVRPAEPSYTDVGKERWFYAAVETMLANGAVAAAGQEFRPTDDLTRGEMASMLVRGLGYSSALAEAAASYGVPFGDVSVNKGFVTMAYDLGLMNGKKDGRFDPDGAATREQAAAVLVRLHDQMSAASVRLPAAGRYKVITIATPMAKSGDEMPITPLEPLPELYATLRRMKNNGEDMSQAALRLMAGGVRTLTDGGGNLVGGSELISAAEVESALAGKDVNTFYSEQYQSAYCICAPNAYQTAYIWYQSDESMAAKLRLARLFGVTRYILE